MIAHRFQFSDLPSEVVGRLSQYSLYTSPTFARAWNATGGKDTYWAAEQDGKILAVLPSVEFGRGPFRRLQSMPDGLFAKLLVLSDAMPRDAAAAVIFEAIRSRGYAKVYITDFDNSLALPEGYHQASSETSVVDISSADWEPPDPTLRSEIRKAEREGVVIQDFDQKNHLSGFLRLLRQTESRHSRSAKYPDEFFVGLANLAQTDHRIVWRMVEHDGRPAAGHIYFQDGEHALYWLSCFDKEFSFLKANQYILFSTAREMSTRGVKVLNLGQSPPDAETLSAFKMNWGGRPYSYPLYTLRSLLGKMA